MSIQQISSFSLPAALVAALIGSAVAQDAPKPAEKQPQPAASTARDVPPTPSQVKAAVPGLTLATKLKGVNIVDAGAATLGEVVELVVDHEGGVVVIADRDGGGLVAIPLEFLEARLDVDAGDVEAAAKDRSEGQRPETPQVDAFLLRTKTELLTTAPALDKDHLASLDAAAFAGIRRHWEGKEPLPGEARPAPKDEAVKTGLCVAHAVGKAVKSPSAEALGEIKDVVIDLPANKVAYVLISSGGVLGVGETIHGVALDALACNGSKDGYTLNTDRKTLDSSPGIDLDRLPSRPSFQITAKASLAGESYAHGTQR